MVGAQPGQLGAVDDRLAASISTSRGTTAVDRHPRRRSSAALNDESAIPRAASGASSATWLAGQGHLVGGVILPALVEDGGVML